MKFISLIYIGILLGASGCSHERFHPRTGDLLFQVNASSAMTDAITDATAEKEEVKLSHVALFLEEEGADWVIEASGEDGVRRTTWGEFLASSAQIGGRPGVIVKRVKGRFPVDEAIERAKSHLGEPYDYSFLPDNGKMYCSELIYECYRREDGSPIFTARPMNFRNASGELPAFWAELFDRLGEPVPEGIPGTNPSDMAREPVLEEVYRYF